MKQLILSCSLSDASRSRILALNLASALGNLGADVELLDLRDFPLPLCRGGETVRGDELSMALAAKIEQADAVSLAVPIYNYDVGGVARNLLAVTGKVWMNKVVGLLGAAGGQRSYMSLMPLANSLMLDFRCVIVPRFIYASGQSFVGQKLEDPELAERITELAAELQRFGGALGAVR